MRPSVVRLLLLARLFLRKGELMLSLCHTFEQFVISAT